MNEFSKRYGVAIIPKGTLLFRAHIDTSFNDCMFFATKLHVACGFGSKIQVWKTEIEIEVLFLVDHLEKDSRAISNLADVYRRVYENESLICTSLSIKNGDISKRNQFARKLFDEHNISGWLSSLEEKVELEIYLLDKQANKNNLSLCDIISKDNNQYFQDSLNSIKISPPKEFFSKTYSHLGVGDSSVSERKDLYKRYERMVNRWIEDETLSGKSKVEAIHYYFDLRIKLKI